MIHVVLVDDQPGVRSVLHSLLQNHRDVEVVGEAADGLQAIAATQRLRPDSVVMDVHMPRMNGVDATLPIKRRWPSIVVICISSDPAPHIFAAIKGSGAVLLISKGREEELYRAIIDHSPPLRDSSAT